MTTRNYLRRGVQLSPLFTSVHSVRFFLPPSPLLESVHWKMAIIFPRFSLRLPEPLMNGEQGGLFSPSCPISPFTHTLFYPFSPLPPSFPLFSLLYSPSSPPSLLPPRPSLPHSKKAVPAALRLMGN